MLKQIDLITYVHSIQLIVHTLNRSLLQYSGNSLWTDTPSFYYCRKIFDYRFNKFDTDLSGRERF